jgi:hypothetical protein
MNRLTVDLTIALQKVTAPFFAQKRKSVARGRARLSREQLARLSGKRKKKAEIKDAAWEIMETTYLKASDDGTLPANVRQIMYAARPLILEITGGTIWENDSYFTQTLLPDYIDENPEETEDWDVVYDARGHLTEPHVRFSLGLGTLNVRHYIKSWDDDGEELDVQIDELYPTKGPRNRYRFALFIEKEGFDSLLDHAQIAARYDLAIFSSKGMSTTATRQLVERLSEEGVTILVVHDFDKAGLGIMHTLGHDTKRYEFDTVPTVIDLGLRLPDVKNLELEAEPVSYSQQKDPKEILYEYGATEEEADFLVTESEYREGASGLKLTWKGQRVELNAMTSRQFIAWLEGKLKEQGVKKVMPEASVLASAFHRAKDIQRLAKSLEEIKSAPDDSTIPKDLEKRLRKVLRTKPELSWDKAMLEILTRAS